MTFTSWIILAVVFIVLFGVGMLVGIKRKSVNTVIFAVAMFFLSMGSAAVGVFMFFVKRAVDL